jgi:hypothetical protein
MIIAPTKDIQTVHVGPHDYLIIKLVLGAPGMISDVYEAIPAELRNRVIIIGPEVSSDDGFQLVEIKPHPIQEY